MMSLSALVRVRGAAARQLAGGYDVVSAVEME
jgi:hypothetical protein